MAKQQKVWTYVPPKPAKPAAPAEALKAKLTEKAAALIEKTLKPKYVEPPPADRVGNHLVDIGMEWHRSSLFLVATYACQGPNAVSPSFESKFARIELDAVGTTTLSFMRHTGAWVRVYADLTVDACLKAIRDDPWFIP